MHIPPVAWKMFYVEIDHYILPSLLTTLVNYQNRKDYAAPEKYTQEIYITEFNFTSALCTVHATGFSNRCILIEKTRHFDDEELISRA